MVERIHLKNIRQFVQDVEKGDLIKLIFSGGQYVGYVDEMKDKYGDKPVVYFSAFNPRFKGPFPMEKKYFMDEQTSLKTDQNGHVETIDDVLSYVILREVG